MKKKFFVSIKNEKESEIFVFPTLKNAKSFQ